MFDLTIPQQNIWNLQRFYEGTSISNNCGAIFYDAKRDHALLNQAINRLILSQEGMRLQFCEVDGHPAQYVAEYQEELFPSEYFTTEAIFEEYAQQFAKTPFELIDKPMYRFVIFDVVDRTGVLLCANHMISDAWAISIIANTVSGWYDALSKGELFDEKNYNYHHFIESEQEYLHSPRYEKDKAYWEEQYSAKPEICSIKPSSTPVTLPTAKRYSMEISSELSGKINQFCTASGTTQAVLFEAAIVAYLARINPENHAVSLGVPVLNRSGAAEKNAVGMCISTTPLTIPVASENTMMELCNEIKKRQFQLFRHQRFPYSHIQRDLHERFDFSGNLYDVMVSYQNAQTGTTAKTKWYSNGCCEVGLEFHIDNRDNADRYTLNIDYQVELFHQEQEIVLLTNRILSMIQQIIDNPSCCLGEITVLPEQEYQQVIYDFNDTAVDYPKYKCVHELFCEQVQKHPEKIALIFEDQQFTYRQLDEMSNSLAYDLRSRGVQPCSIVPIISKRSWHVIVAMVGVLKAGAAYMPVDPTYPKDRIDFMFETAQCVLALTYGYTGDLDVEAIDLASFDFTSHSAPIENLNNPDDLCYIIFTSGSTGKPKGVSLCHRNVVNYSDNNNNNVCHQIIEAQNDSIVSVTNIIFDIFVTESLLPLLNGIAIYFANDEQVFSQKKLAELISNNSIDVIQTTPTKMRSYIMDKQNVGYLRKLKAIVLGGEALPVDLYLELRGYTDAKIFNIYGPAETTVWSTNKCVEDTHITIGRPIANTQVYILDAKRQPMPIGIAGELCISGDGVGKGYLNRPKLTAEKFIPNPFLPGKMMYCTGDLARWRADGEIEYLGRIDTQVKIRGLRIELGEIESVMSGFDGIQLTAVTDKKGKTGRQYLVGYYTAAVEIDEKALRQYLSAKLPKYMVPNYFVHLDEMPMTASGKTDRKNLPLPVFASIAQEYAAPETELETNLCAVLAELFGVEQFSVTDDFFDMGGDSLGAIEYVAKAHTHGVDFALQNVFDYPTVRLLSGFLTGGERQTVQYVPEDFDCYESLLAENVIDETYVPVKKSLGDVLLTGATGFLGAHILDQYMKEEQGTIYCLVRGGGGHLLEILRYYFGDCYDAQIGNRIIVIDGDITKENLSDDLNATVQTVIHTAATVKHYGSYDYFRKINVQGTQNVIAYAKRCNARMIHISTLSVSGNSLVDAFDIYRAKETMYFDETSLYIGQPLDNVYIHSKFEAERSVLDAMLAGLDAKIIRVGNLTNRASDLKFQPNYQSNAFLTRVKAGLELGCLPDYLLPLYSEFSPIDQTAEGVLKIAQYADVQTVFHLNSNQNLYFERMVKILNQLGIAMNIVDGDSFRHTLQELVKDDHLSYIYEAFQNDMDESGNLVYNSNIRILNDFTLWFMKKLGFEWAEIDFDYIKGYIEYFRSIGYLEV